MSMDKVIEFVKTRDHELFNVIAQQGAEPTEKQVAEFEDRIGFRFPDDYREYLVHPLGGIYIEAQEAIWPRPELYSVGPFWSFLYGFFAYGLSEEAPEMMNMPLAWEEMSEEGYPKLVPFLKVIGDADPYCFTEKGDIVIWRHEEPDEPEPFKGTFSDAIVHELEELSERIQLKLKEK